MDKTLLQKLDAEVPPFWCFAWARKKARGAQAGPRIISQRSGIPYRTVQRISAQISWVGIDIAVVSAFIKACGLRMQPKANVIRMNEIHAYQRWCAKRNHPGYPVGKYPALRPFAHLNDHQYRLLGERSKKWLEMQANSKAASPG